MHTKVIRLTKTQIAPEDIQAALDDAIRWIQGPFKFITQSETRTLEDDKNIAWETVTITIFYEGSNVQASK